MWLLWLLSMVLKNCCHGPSTETGNGLFLPLCAATSLWFKAKHQRDVEGDFLLTLGQVWAGQRASQHAWPQGPFWSSTFRICSHSLTSVIFWRFDMVKMWVCSWYRASVVARHYKVLGTWDFSWATEKNSGWHLFIPSSFAVWLLSRTSWTS